MPDEPRDKQTLSVQVDKELARRAKIKAAQTGKPMAEVMREALEEWTKENGKNKAQQ